MAGAPDWPHVLVVTHWGVIRSLTGRTVKNCETVRLDPTAPTADGRDGTGPGADG
jgi:broad specificity phosphatase PhoE